MKTKIEKEIFKMNKKTLGKVAAASMAAMTAVSAMSVTASAMVGSNGVASGSVYAVTITTPGATGSNGVTTPSTSQTVYYTSADTANAAINALAVGQTASSTETTVNAAFGNGTVIYVGSDGKITKENYGGTKYTTSGTTTTTPGTTTPNYGYSYQYASSTNNVYLGTNGKWYPNLSSLYTAGTSLSNTVPKPEQLTYQAILNSSATKVVYFNKDTGEFSADVPNGTDWVQILGYSSNYDYYYNTKPANYDTYDVYQVGGVYYPTLSSALSAAGNNYNLITKIYDYSRPQTNYFSKVTGKYYSTYADALAASRNSASNVYTFSYYTSDYYYDDTYGYYYGDPYYYYWLRRQNSTTDDTSSKNDTTTATVGNRKGWTAISKYLGTVKTGSSVTVSMNYETTVPASVMSAIKGKNVTVKFVLKNGVTFTINGRDVSSASDINIDTAYNTSMVPTKLVKAAYKKNKAVSSAQITISGGSFGAEADVTVKFATKRAGCTAKLYRYNPGKETLSLVDTAKVQSNGKCTFGDVDKGGNFVITLS